MAANEIIALIVLLGLVFAVTNRLNGEAKKRREREQVIAKERPWRRR